MTKIISELQHLGEFLIENDLAWGTSGNISMRANEKQYYITASGSEMGSLAKEDLIIYPNNELNSKKPSKEYRFHDAIYKNRPDINAVIHSSPFYSTLLACSDIEINSNYFIESMYYLERIETIPYAHPGTEELSQFIEEKAKLSNIFILKNHGVIVADTNVKEALMSLQTLEFTSKMIINALSAGISLTEIDNNKVLDFLENSRYKPRRNWEEIEQWN